MWYYWSMAKTKETLQLEDALRQRSRKKREYGCEEVTIGFTYENKGNEIVDFMSMDAHEVFRCYEIKISLSDLKSNNALSWYGDYNYLVISEDLWMRDIDFDNYIPPYAGILVSDDLQTMRNAKKKAVSDTDRKMLKDSLLRSLYWRMVQYQDAGSDEILKQLQKDQDALKNEYEQYRRQVDRTMFTEEDYVRYYGMNHQCSPDLEQMAKGEREQYFLRKEGKMAWQKEDDHLCCPVCGYRTKLKSAFCPACGVDLRQLIRK